MRTYWRREGRFGAVAVVLLSVLTVTGLEGRAAGSSAEKISLGQAAVVVDPDQPSFVEFAVEELAGYLKELTGSDLAMAPVPVLSQRVQILVGPKSVQQVVPLAIPDQSLGEEGYRLQCVAQGGNQYVVATGATPRGTKAALAALMKAIQVEGNQAFVPAALDVSGRPAFVRRGMHLNGWPLGYPYTFRSWREADWQRYLDFLSYQGVNLFYLWPFIEIMPVPLSAEDQAYLEECRRVIDYAQKKHGMEVWIMQCTNRVAKDRCGVADPRLRPYWRPCQEDLNPGKPEDFAAILASREAMYRILDNADGVCNIDSDPGFCAGSPQTDYVKVLQACRAMLDRYNLHGKDAKLVNWMLWGWGRAQKIQLEGLAEHQRLALRALKEGLPEPFWMISGQFPESLPMCRAEGLASRTVLLPYGTIEGEPAYPQTQLKIDAIRGMFDGTDAQSPDIAGMMGNVQTPLLQLPNSFFFTAVMSDFEYRKRSEPEVLLDLAGYVYPDHRQLLADSYLALKGDDPAKIELLDGQLQELLRTDAFGRLGLFGRKLFPDHRIVATSAHLQLRLRAARQRLLAGVTPTTPRDECVRLLCDYFDAYIAWDLAQGWHALWGWQAWPLPDLPVGTLAGNLRKSLSNNQDLDACFEEVSRRLSAKHDAAIVEQGCIAPLKGAIPR